jgi:hypothetical protein
MSPPDNDTRISNPPNCIQKVYQGALKMGNIKPTPAEDHVLVAYIENWNRLKLME